LLQVQVQVLHLVQVQVQVPSASASLFTACSACCDGLRSMCYTKGLIFPQQATRHARQRAARLSNVVLCAARYAAKSSWMGAVGAPCAEAGRIRT
jgi:hypothetical protein